MSKCRACLKSLRNMITFDEKYIMYFNILTNLNLELSLGEPQYLCKRCFKTLQQFIEFREKCIAANAVFSNVIPKENIKQEDSFNTVSHEIEVKQETEVNDYEAPIEFDNYCGASDGELKYENDFVYELISKTEGKIEENGKSKDIKSTKRKTKYTKRKATCEENGKSKDIKSTKRKTKYTKRKATCDEIPKRKETKTVETKEKEKNIIFESTSATSLPCGLCTKSLEDNTQLDLHILSTHKQSNVCFICEEKFVDWLELISHRAKHLPDGRHTCHLCPTRFFKTAIFLENHYRKKHYAEGEKLTLRCRICDRRYATPKRLNSHNTETHNINNNRFICDFCNKVCYSRKLLMSHMRMHMDYKRYFCDLCGFSSKYSTRITVHRIAKHNPDRVYCLSCKKLFASATLRDQHVCKRLDALNVCPVCGKTCRSLQRHMRVHDDVKPHACPRCPARFRYRTAWAVHVDKHDGVRRHACDLCPAKFYFPSVLIKHRRTHTGIKPYVCKVCQKAFTGSNNLKVHMKVHGKFLIKKKEESLDEEIQIFIVAPTSRSDPESRPACYHMSQT